MGIARNIAHEESEFVDTIHGAAAIEVELLTAAPEAFGMMPASLVWRVLWLFNTQASIEKFPSIRGVPKSMS